jgi:hypothetical protein
MPEGQNRALRAGVDPIRAVFDHVGLNAGTPGNSSWNAPAVRQRCVPVPQPSRFVRWRTSFMPILRVTSGCALTLTPCLATSRNIASSTTRLRHSESGSTQTRTLSAFNSRARTSSAISSAETAGRAWIPTDASTSNARKAIAGRSCVGPRLSVTAPKDRYLIRFTDGHVEFSQ